MESVEPFSGPAEPVVGGEADEQRSLVHFTTELSLDHASDVVCADRAVLVLQREDAKIGDRLRVERGHPHRALEAPLRLPWP
jgi:hypothetical protein